MVTRQPMLESPSHKNALFLLCLLGLLTPMTLGCLLGGPSGGDGDDGDDGILFGDGDEWQDEVDDRRMERDDPESPLYRGTFELQLEGEARLQHRRPPRHSLPPPHLHTTTTPHPPK